MAEMEPDADLHHTKSAKKKKKKSHSTSSRLTVKIEAMNPDPDKSAPFVGYFPSGYNPHETIPQSEFENEPPSFHVYRHQTKPKRCQLVVRPNEWSPVSFVGDSHSGEAAAAQMCTYALGVLDKETQSLKIMPIASDKIFRLDPRVIENAPEKEPSTPPLQVQATTADKVRDLTAAYGTKRAIKKVANSLKLREDIGGEGEEVGKLQEDIDKEAFASTSTQITRSIPPCNLSATEPEKAYPLDKIILAGEWDSLTDIFDLLQAGDEIRMDSYASFVCNRAYKLELVQDVSEKRRLSSILSYINHLVKFKDRNSMDGYKSARQHALPGILYNRFTGMFVDTTRRELSKEKLSLLISYVLVLTLFVDNFESDPEDISRDLRMTTAELRDRYQILGCKLKRINKKTMATLPVPLKFEVRRKRGRG